MGARRPYKGHDTALDAARGYPVSYIIVLIPLARWFGHVITSPRLLGIYSKLMYRCKCRYAKKRRGFICFSTLLYVHDLFQGRILCISCLLVYLDLLC